MGKGSRSKKKAAKRGKKSPSKMKVDSEAADGQSLPATPTTPTPTTILHGDDSSDEVPAHMNAELMMSIFNNPSEMAKMSEAARAPLSNQQPAPYSAQLEDEAVRRDLEDEDEVDAALAELDDDDVGVPTNGFAQPLGQANHKSASDDAPKVIFNIANGKRRRLVVADDASLRNAVELNAKVDERTEEVDKAHDDQPQAKTEARQGKTDDNDCVAVEEAAKAGTEVQPAQALIEAESATTTTREAVTTPEDTTVFTTSPIPAAAAASLEVASTTSKATTTRKSRKPATLRQTHSRPKTVTVNGQVTRAYKWLVPDSSDDEDAAAVEAAISSTVSSPPPTSAISARNTVESPGTTTTPSLDVKTEDSPFFSLFETTDPPPHQPQPQAQTQASFLRRAGSAFWNTLGAVATATGLKETRPIVTMKAGVLPAPAPTGRAPMRLSYAATMEMVKAGDVTGEYWRQAAQKLQQAPTQPQSQATLPVQTPLPETGEQDEPAVSARKKGKAPVRLPADQMEPRRAPPVQHTQAPATPARTTPVPTTQAQAVTAHTGNAHAGSSRLPPPPLEFDAAEYAARQAAHQAALANRAVQWKQACADAAAARAEAVRLQAAAVEAVAAAKAARAAMSTQKGQPVQAVATTFQLGMAADQAEEAAARAMSAADKAERKASDLADERLAPIPKMGAFPPFPPSRKVMEEEQFKACLEAGGLLCECAPCVDQRARGLPPSVHKAEAEVADNSHALDEHPQHMVNGVLATKFTHDEMLPLPPQIQDEEGDDDDWSKEKDETGAASRRSVSMPGSFPTQAAADDVVLQNEKKETGAATGRPVSPLPVPCDAGKDADVTRPKDEKETGAASGRPVSPVPSDNDGDKVLQNEMEETGAASGRPVSPVPSDNDDDMVLQNEVEETGAASGRPVSPLPSNTGTDADASDEEEDKEDEDEEEREDEDIEDVDETPALDSDGSIICDSMDIELRRYFGLAEIDDSASTFPSDLPSDPTSATSDPTPHNWNWVLRHFATLSSDPFGAVALLNLLVSAMLISLAISYTQSVGASARSGPYGDYYANFVWPAWADDLRHLGHKEPILPFLPGWALAFVGAALGAVQMAALARKHPMPVGLMLVLGALVYSGESEVKVLGEWMGQVVANHTGVELRTQKSQAWKGMPTAATVARMRVGNVKGFSVF